MRETRLAGLRSIVVESSEAPRLAVLTLHGYAMEADALVPFARSIGVPAEFHFLEGPHLASPTGRAWWPLDLERRARALAAGPRELSAERPGGLADARTRLLRAIEALHQEVPTLPLVIVGFSQGGMLALDTVLRERPTVVALALLSSSRITGDEWLPLAHRLKGMPILISHGTRDDDLSFGAGEQLRDFCINGAARVSWVPFDGGHEIPLVVWRSLRSLLRSLSETERGPADP